MLYVNNGKMGNVDICDLQINDIKFITLLLERKSQNTDNPNIQYCANRLANFLTIYTSDSNYEIDWSDVFLICSVLLDESADTIDEERKQQAARLLIDFDAAIGRI